jgi:hydroxymethylpyrimidine/phosphomethylpyrimidine kinase
VVAETGSGTRGQRAGGIGSYRAASRFEIDCPIANGAVSAGTGCAIASAIFCSRTTSIVPDEHRASGRQRGARAHSVPFRLGQGLAHRRGERIHAHVKVY